MTDTTKANSLTALHSALTMLNTEAMDGLQIFDAASIAQSHYPQIVPTVPLLLYNLTTQQLAVELQQTLQTAYPSRHLLTLLHPESSEQSIITFALDELDQHAEFGDATSLYLPPVEEGGSFQALQEVVAHLRAPDGCPWDRKQTLLTLREGLVNECFELVEALDIEEGGTDNVDHIAEELGDVLLLPAMMIQIASEEGRFQMADVGRGIVTKLIRRHPHVFADLDVDGVDEVLTNWDAIKAQEKADRGEKPRGPLDGVPEALPALQKAHKLQSKAHKANLIDREVLADSVEQMLDQFNAKPTVQTLGALLWSTTALAKRHNLNAEDALRSYAVQFRANAEAG